MYLYWLSTLNWLLSVGTLFLLAATIVLFVDYFAFRGRYLGALAHQFAWLSIIGVTVGSVVMSLVYSEYFGFIPCSLCWLQRIAIYPQALISLIAFKTGDVKNFTLYGIALSIFGLGVSIYQYIYQMIPAEAVTGGVLPCLVDESGADCAVKVIDEFGFVTFPFIAAVSFAFLIVVYLYQRQK